MLKKHLNKIINAGILLCVLASGATQAFETCPDMNSTPNYDDDKWVLMQAPIHGGLPQSHNTFSGATWRVVFGGIACTYNLDRGDFTYILYSKNQNLAPTKTNGKLDGNWKLLKLQSAVCPDGSGYDDCPFTDKSSST